MSRYSKLRHELVENINSQIKFGQSKHQAKQKAIKEAHERGSDSPQCRGYTATPHSSAT